MKDIIQQINDSLKNILDEMEEKGIQNPVIEKEIENLRNARDKLIVLKGQLEGLTKRIKDF